MPANSTSPRSPRPRPRVLFVAEAVTLAHIGRSSALAHALDPFRYDVHLACDDRCRPFLGNVAMPIHSVRSVDPVAFAERLRNGDPIYTEEELRAAVLEDLGVLGSLRPEAVVGDMRVSLGIAARVAGIPYATVTNAHWSPWSRSRYVVPELAIVDRLGPRLGQWLFDLLRPWACARQVLMFNRIRRDYGLPSIPPTLARLFTDADAVWYADVPSLVPTPSRPSHHEYIGPILWSPVEPSLLPEMLPRDRPMAYVSMGSSGAERHLTVVLKAVERLGYGAIVSTAGKLAPRNIPRFVHIRAFLPGLEAARVADLVICNGGSPTVYQAMAAGVPVLGLPSNLDQYLMMEHVERTGVGLAVRSGTAGVENVAQAITTLLVDPRWRDSVRSVQASIQLGAEQARMQDLIDRLIGAGAMNSYLRAERHERSAGGCIPQLASRDTSV